MEKIPIPGLIKPEIKLLSSELVEVKPLSNPSAGLYYIDYTYTPKAPLETITVNITLDKFTDEFNETVKKELGL